MLDKRICLLGCHEVGCEIVQYLFENNIKINYFIVLSPEQGKKYNVSGYFNYKDLAIKYNVPIYYPEKYSLNSEKDIDFFKKERFDLLVQGGWQRLIPEKVLSTFSIGAIGGHGSANFLPYGRGRSPLNWSLIEGRKRFIMQLFLMKPGVDDGDIFDYEQFDINEFDDIETLYYKNSIVTKKMLVRSIPKLINNSIKLYRQEGKETYYPKRTEEDGVIKWDELRVEQIYDFIRAQTKPYPGAFSFIGDNKIYLWKAQIFDRSIKYKGAKYGEIVEVFKNKNFIVNCLDGLLLVAKYDYSKTIQKKMLLKCSDKK